jgi:hypothetical protein
MAAKEIIDQSEDVAKLTKALHAERVENKANLVLLNAAKKQIADAAALGTAPSPIAVSQYISDGVKAGVAHATNELQLKIGTLESELVTAKTAATDMGVKLVGRTISEEIRQACRDSHIKPEAVNDVLTIGVGELQLVDGVVQTAEGVSLSDWVEQRKAASPYWWPVARGSGARGSGADGLASTGAANPWSKESWNMTQQGNLVKSDPALAERMKASAVQ